MTRHVDLIERLRALLAEEPSTREVSMFGGRSFMVNDKMIASALQEGDLLARRRPRPPPRHKVADLSAFGGFPPEQLSSSGT